MIESVLLFLAVIVVLLAGYPVAFTLAGTAILFAVIGLLTGNFEIGYLNALPVSYTHLTLPTILLV